MAEYLPSSRGTSSTCGLASAASGPDADSRAASMDARTSGPEVSSGTTMVGSTTMSSSGSTGSERVELIRFTSLVDYLLTHVKSRVPQFVSGRRSR